MLTKKILIVSLLFFFVSAFGAPVSIETAEKVAKKHLERKKHGGKIKRARAYKTKTFTPYFVFEKESKGFIVVSADNIAVPILGETDSGVFDKDSMPPALVWLLETYEKQIEQAAKSGKAQDNETKALWEQSMIGSEPLMAVSYPTKLLSTTWAQGEPYNLKAPLDGSKRSVTGCVATAMAQIMKYYQHPARGTGASDAYKTKTKNISVPSVTFNTSYDYDNMLNSYPYTSSGNTVEREAISTLMHHSGVSVEMDYSSDGSGAYFIKVAQALTKYFGYDNSVRYIFSSNSTSISASDWKGLVIGQIENNSPVYYGGQDPVNGGHAFIIDGYNNSTDVFHLNWGWGGSHDGFFVLTALNPDKYKFNTDQIMIINIMPNKNGNPPSQIKVSSFNVSATETTLNASIRAKMNYGADFSGKIGFAVMSGGTVSMVLDSANYSISNTYNQESGRYTVNYNDASFSKLLGTNVPYGNLTLQVVTKRGTGAWTPVGETRSVTILAPVTVNFNANGGTVTPEMGTTSTEGKLASLPVPTRDGYTFNGWFTAVTGGTEVTTSTVFNTNNTTIYARWTLITYTVTFNANGGSGTAPSSIANIIPGSTLGTAQMPSTSGFTKSGYVNDGKWYLLTGTNTSNTYNITVAMRDSYGDGWNGSALRISVNGTDLPTKPTISSSSSSGTYTFNVNAGDVVAFYWVSGSYDYECAFAVYYTNNPPNPAFNPASGASNDNTRILLSKQYSNSGSVSTGTLLGSFTAPAPATYSEFLFGDDGTAVTANTTLYLKWIPSYIVNFNLDGGFGTAPASIDVMPNSRLNVAQMPSTTGFTKNGYVNDGKWYIRTGASPDYTYTEFVFGNGGTVVADNNTTLYLKWIPGYIISFDLDGGSGTKPANIIISDIENNTLSTEQMPSTTGFTKNGYVNDGKWYTRTGASPNYTYTEFVFGDEGTAVTAHTTLYIKWTPTYTVTFNLDGGSGTVPASIANVVQGNTLSTEQMPSTTDFTKSGYANDGKWHTRTSTSVSTTYNITVAMRDSYGDGWNGSALRISVNGTDLSTKPTVSGSSGTYTFSVNSGDVVAFYWVKGSYDSECAFAVYYTNNPPSPAFNPASGASNDNTRILLSKQYGSLSVSTGTLLGSFTAPVPTTTYTEFIFGEGGTEITDHTTLYLKWTPTYTITFNANSGTVTPSTSTTGLNRTLASLPTPTRDGYTFDGWFTAETGGTHVTTSTVFSANATIYARWTLITYTVIFNANNGSVSPTSSTTGIGWKLTSLPTPTRDGYTFDGWFTEETGGTQVTTSTVFNADTTIYAQWTVTLYTVTFNANSGSGTAPASITNIVRGSTLSAEQMPSTSGFTKSGYANDGKWYTRTGTSPNYTYTEFVFGDEGTAVTANITLYPKWIPIYNVSFNLDGGSGTVPASIANVVQGSTLSAVQMPSTTDFTKSRYVNDGKWHTRTSTSVSATYNITVTMRDSYGDGWNGSALRISVNGTDLSTKPTISGSSGTYTFSVNSGDVVAFYWVSGNYDSECAFAVYYTNNPPSPAFNPASGSSNDNTRILLSKQYGSLSVSNGTSLGSFTTTASTTTYTYTEFIFGEGGTAITDHTTLYLKWAPTYTITFNANNGSVSPTSSTIGLNRTLASLPTPTRDGYTFDGWFTEETGGTQVTTSTIFSSDTTIYAQWTLDPTETPIFPNRENPTIGRIGVQTTTNTILLSNLPQNAKIEVYNLQGKRIYSTTSHSPLATSHLKIEVQTKGIYIVKIGTQTIRTAVR